MRKIIAVMLSLVFILSFSACKNSVAGTDKDAAENSSLKAQRDEQKEASGGKGESDSAEDESEADASEEALTESDDSDTSTVKSDGSTKKPSSQSNTTTKKSTTTNRNSTTTTKSSTVTTTKTTTTTKVTTTQDYKLSANSAFEAFSVADIYGTTRTHKIFKGHKLTMVNVWATWCGPCRNEMPDLGTLHREYSSRGFQVVGVLWDNDLETAKTIVSQANAGYIHLTEGTSTLYQSLKNGNGGNSIAALPTTFFVNEYGERVGGTYEGSRSLAQWKAIVDSLL